MVSKSRSLPRVAASPADIRGSPCAMSTLILTLGRIPFSSSSGRGRKQLGRFKPAPEGNRSECAISCKFLRHSRTECAVCPIFICAALRDTQYTGALTAPRATVQSKALPSEHHDCQRAREIHWEIGGSHDDAQENEQIAD